MAWGHPGQGLEQEEMESRSLPAGLAGGTWTLSLGTVAISEGWGRVGQGQGTIGNLRS